MENIYCVRCRAKTPNVGKPQLARNSKGRMMLTAPCKKCGTKKFQFVSQKKAQELAGSGLLGNLLGTKLPILSDIPLLGDILF